jgi:uncharacterized membrane protein
MASGKAQVPVNADVKCTDSEKVCGQTVAVIVNPVSNELTHLVVEDKTSKPAVQRLVGVDRITATSTEGVELSCSEAELAEMDPFIETRYIKSEMPDYKDSLQYGEYSLPYGTPSTTQTLAVPEEQVPEGGLAVHKGMQVEATDGRAGTVDELLVDPSGNRVTHVVMLEGHMWGKRRITFPLSAIDHVAGNTVYMKLSQQQIDGLPDVPATHKYEGVELVAMVYDTPDGAKETLEFVQDLARRKTFELKTAAVMTKDEDGKLSVKETADLTGRQGATFGAIAGGIVGIIGGPVGVALGAALGAGIGGLIAGRMDTGLPNEFLQKFDDSLQPGGSALVILVRTQWRRSFAEELGGLPGLMVQDTLTDEMIEQILEGDKKK